jgi:lipopolysaccharide export LptBFGC system permease protein LptF
MTSDTFDGVVMFEFDDKTNLLLSYSIEDAELSEEQQIWLLKNLPREMAEVKSILEKSPGIKFNELKIEVDFDMFWQKYDDKITSSKKRTLKAWDKLSKANQIMAYNHIQRYIASLPMGTRKKYAETYLNAELWNN